jgi:hypothetical protein
MVHRNAAVADLNGDGKMDVIAANRPGPSFVCLNDGKARFTSACIPIPAESATTIAPADFDKDGFIDLAVPSRDGGQSRIYFNDGKAALPERRHSVPPTPRRESALPRTSTGMARSTWPSATRRRDR